MKNIKVVNIFPLLLLIFVLSKNVTTNPLTTEKCSLENSDCLKKQAQAALYTFVKGDPTLGIKSFDRLILEDVVVKKPTVRYELRKPEIIGFNDTIIDDLSIDLTFKLMRINFHTTLMVYSGYEVDGLVFGFPVFGKGKSVNLLQNLHVEIVILFDIVKNEQGKHIMDLKGNFFGADAIDGLYSYLGNLYNGDKQKSDAFHEIMNKNWRSISANFGRPFTSQVVQHIFEAIQIYMRSVPLEDLAQYSP